LTNRNFKKSFHVITSVIAIVVFSHSSIFFRHHDIIFNWRRFTSLIHLLLDVLKRRLHRHKIEHNSPAGIWRQQQWNVNIYSIYHVYASFTGIYCIHYTVYTYLTFVIRWPLKSSFVVRSLQKTEEENSIVAADLFLRFRRHHRRFSWLTRRQYIVIRPIKYYTTRGVCTPNNFVLLLCTQYQKTSSSSVYDAKMWKLVIRVRHYCWTSISNDACVAAKSSLYTRHVDYRRDFTPCCTHIFYLVVAY